MEFVYGIYIRYIPYATLSSLWFLPKKTHSGYYIISGINGKYYLLTEDWFCLTAETLLFAVITSSTLGCMTFLRLFVLCYFVWLMNFAFLAKGSPLLRYVHLKTRIKIYMTAHNLKMTFQQLDRNMHFLPYIVESRLIK